MPRPDRDISRLGGSARFVIATKTAIARGALMLARSGYERDEQTPRASQWRARNPSRRYRRRSHLAPARSLRARRSEPKHSLACGASWALPRTMPVDGERHRLARIGHRRLDRESGAHPCRAGAAGESHAMSDPSREQRGVNFTAGAIRQLLQRVARLENELRDLRRNSGDVDRRQVSIREEPQV